MNPVEERLAELRDKIMAESISLSEVAELQAMADYIDLDDLLLLEWAGVPEYHVDPLFASAHPDHSPCMPDMRCLQCRRRVR